VKNFGANKGKWIKISRHQNPTDCSYGHAHY